jgi:hypothetical protein
MPLAYCKKLESISIAGRYPKSIDITPLFSCPNLDRVELQFSDYGRRGPEAHFPERIQLLYRPTTLKVAKGIDFEDYQLKTSPIPKKYRDSKRGIHPIGKRIIEDGVDKVRELVKLLSKRMNTLQKKELQIVVMSQLGLSSYCVVDIDVSKIFDEMPDDAKLNQVQNRVKEIAFPLLAKHLRQGKTSIFLDIDDLEGTEIEGLMSSILKQRREELEKTRIILRKYPRKKFETYDKKYNDVRYLWLTAYGFQVLRELGHYSLTKGERRTEKLMERFNELGYNLRITESGRRQIPKGMSSTLRDCIWKMIEKKSIIDLDFNQILVPPSTNIL